MFRRVRIRYQQWVSYKQSLKKKNRLLFMGVDLVESLVVALIFALIIRHYIIQTSFVPTGSMIPTLKINDRLFVNRYIYRFNSPKRGDIVVFNSPHNDNKDYVKRCIAIPGDSIKITDGIVYINNARLLLPGVRILADRFNMPEQVVPEKSYFMLGDNRGNSEDSRYWGFVHETDLQGKAIFTFWPLSRMRVLQ